MSAAEEIEALAEVLAVHNHQFGSNEIRLWSYCRCTPNAELSGVDDLSPEYGSRFYVEGIDAFRAHLSEAILASDRLSALLAAREVEAAARALDEAADDAKQVRETSVLKNPVKPFDHGYADGMRLVEGRLRERARGIREGGE